MHKIGGCTMNSFDKKHQYEKSCVKVENINADQIFKIEWEPLDPIILLKVVLIQSIIIIGLLLCRIYNYNLFHFFIEGYTIAVSLSIYFIVINSMKEINNSFLIIISIGYLSLAVLDSIHVLTYAGMNIFTGNSSSLPSQLWIFARYLQGLTFLCAVVFTDKKVTKRVVYGIYFAITVFGLFMIFTERFPITFIDGVGLTPFKKISEYIITVIMLFVIFYLYRKRKLFDSHLLKYLYIALSLSMLSEFMFTLYTNYFAIENLIGHYFKFLSIYFVYKAVVQLAIKSPQTIIFRELTLKQNEVKDNIIMLETINQKNIALIDNFHEQVFVMDKNFILKECYLPQINCLQFSAETMLGRSLEDIKLPTSACEKIRDAYRRTLLTGKPERAEYYIDLSEVRYWFDAQISIVPESKTMEERILCTVRDITSHVALEEIMYNEKEQFKTTLLSVGDGIIATDRHGRIIVMNPIAEKLTEWTQQLAFQKPIEEVFRIINEYTKEVCENIVQIVLDTGKIHELTSNCLLVSQSGKEIPVEDSAAPIMDRNEQVTGVVIVFRDCSDSKQKQKEIEYLSFHDHLTGLYNRRYMEDSIERLDNERKLPLAIMAIDVNGLKLTNDVFGHETGDMLIKAVAKILTKACRSDDIIARVGGDEYAILLPNTDELQAESIKIRILDAIGEETIDSAILSLAIGYAVKRVMDKEIVEVQKEADNNMYKDKIKYGKMMRSQTIDNLLHNINNKFNSEKIHIERVSQFSVAIATVMKLSEKEIHDIKMSALLHDIGKIIVPPELLNKPGRLTDCELETIKLHSITGYQILKGVDEYNPFAEAVLHHHERWDGGGYPNGYREEQIPLNSRIIGLADAYEAMTAKRVYQTTKTNDEAVAEIRRCSGTQFDPNIATLFIEKVLMNSID